MNPAVVGRIFTLSQQAILFHPRAGLGHGLRVFVGDAFAALVILLGIFGSPPIPEVAMSIELASLIVEAMNNLVSNDHADGAVIHRVVFPLLKEGRLQNASREVDGVQLWIG